MSVLRGSSALRNGLARSALAVVFGAIGWIAPGSAGAFCRTTTAAVPPSYNPARNGCITSGLELFWRGGCVTYGIQKEGLPGASFEETAKALERAFGTWQGSVCPASGT